MITRFIYLRNEAGQPFEFQVEVDELTVTACRYVEHGAWREVFNLHDYPDARNIGSLVMQGSPVVRSVLPIEPDEAIERLNDAEDVWDAGFYDFLAEKAE